jgi:hypothetical protein
VVSTPGTCTTSSCEGYEDIREGRDLNDNKENVEFFSSVMARRERRGWD